jgi:predicted RNA binding protein YcfA (HicA-like mRNA interferase family)
MSKAEKLLAELVGKPTPRDFLWGDFVTLMKQLGYQELSGSGSRKKFINPDTKHVISLHKPHPGKHLKVYQVKTTITALDEAGLLS